MQHQSHHLQATSPLEEWLSYLENSHCKAIDLGLERIKSVAQLLDLLSPAPLVITVGGTNGKGTTCRLLELILINSGYRVGVYSSPHLIRYNERVRIQNQELADIEHTSSFAFINKYKTQSLTYFEFSTLSALYLFKQAKLDIVILEVGLGGRLDATNIIDNDIAVITSIDIDHVDFLGSSREQIAFEKAGIFKADKKVVIGESNVPEVMLAQAKKLNCLISRSHSDWQFSQQTETWTWQGKDKNNIKVLLKNLPLCQIPLANAATALATIHQLPFIISEQTIYQSLQQVELIGRFQTLKEEQLKLLAERTGREITDFPHIIMDVGHNPHAARYLAEKLLTLKEKSLGKIIAICGILKDKDMEGIFSPLLQLVDQWYCVTLTGYRGQNGRELLLSLQKVAQQYNRNIEANSIDSVFLGIKSAVENADKNDLILVFGSFYTVSEFLQILEIK